MQSRTRWSTFSKQGTYAATTATTMRMSKKKIRTLHLYHIFCAFLCLHCRTTKWPFLISSVRSQAFNSRIIHLHLTMSTKQNQNDEVWNWPFKWSFRCRCRLGSGAITNKIKQHKPYKCYPRSSKIATHWTLYWNPKEEIAQLRRSGLFICKHYRLHFHRPLGSLSEESVRGKSAGLFPEQRLVIEPTKTIDVFI